MEVPNPNTTTPITSGDIFMCNEMLAAPSIKISELKTSSASPIRSTMLGRMRVLSIGKITTCFEGEFKK
jgi:hypothetical protein